MIRAITILVITLVVHVALTHAHASVEPERLAWSSERKFMRTLLKRDVPVIVTHSPSATEWRARDLWSAEYLRERLTGDTGEFVTPLKMSPSRTFRYYMSTLSTAPLGVLPAVVDQFKPSTYTLMRGKTWTDFVCLSADESLMDDHTQCESKPETEASGKNLYDHPMAAFSAHFFSLPALRQDIEPLVPFFFTNEHINPLLNETEQAKKRKQLSYKAYLWMSPAHQHTSAHYDLFPNMHALVKGAKRFTLHPPAFPQPSFPALHPGMRSFPSASLSAPLYDFTLYPSEVLFIPPMWSHAVDSLEFSVSVSVWSDYAPSAKLDQLTKLDLPITPNDTPKEDHDMRTTIVRGYLTLVLADSRLRLKDSPFIHDETNRALSVPQRFFKALLETSYAPLIDSRALPPLLTNENTRSDSIGRFCHNANTMTRLIKGPGYRLHVMREVSNEAVDLLVDIRDAAGPARFLLLLAEFVERVLATLPECGPSQVHQFLSDLVQC